MGNFSQLKKNGRIQARENEEVQHMARVFQAQMELELAIPGWIRNHWCYQKVNFVSLS